MRAHQSRRELEPDDFAFNHGGHVHDISVPTVIDLGNMSR
jgi:hypothetical protein